MSLKDAKTNSASPKAPTPSMLRPNKKTIIIVIQTAGYRDLSGGYTPIEAHAHLRICVEPRASNQSLLQRQICQDIEQWRRNTSSYPWSQLTVEQILLWAGLTFQPTAKPNASSTKREQNAGIAPGMGSHVVISPRDSIMP